MVRFHFFDPDAKDHTPTRAGPKKKHKAGGFTMDWVRELGWTDNPFMPSQDLIAGMEDERKEINLFFVKGKRFGVIQGEPGMGKSTLLHWLHGELHDYADIDNNMVSAHHGTDVQFLEDVWQPFKPMFGGKLPTSHEELVDQVSKKAKGRYVLLVDDADHLEDVGWAAIDALLGMPGIGVIVTMQDTSKLPAADELQIKLKKPSAEAYERILEQRIAAVGGRGIHPFTQKVIAKMGKDTTDIAQFLDLAQETAINIALKHATLEDDVPEEELAAAEEEKAERKKGIKASDESPDQIKARKKREYDELIESLIDEG